MYGPGDTVPLPKAAPTTVEFEVLYILGRDVRPDDAAAPPSDTIAEVRVAFELVVCRFVDRRAVSWPSFAADNSALEALVLDDTIDPSAVGNVTRTLSVVADRGQPAHSLTGEDATDPLIALADVIAIARERRIVLADAASSRPVPSPRHSLSPANP